MSVPDPLADDSPWTLASYWDCMARRQEIAEKLIQEAMKDADLRAEAHAWLGDDV